jgi:hypothetical protein
MLDESVTAKSLSRRPDDPAVAPAARGLGDRVAPVPASVVTCSRGWTQEYSQRWAAKSVSKLHQKLGASDTAHTITIEQLPADPQPGSSSR